MRQRTQSRELALKSIYQIGFQKDISGINAYELMNSADDALDDESPIIASVREYAHEMIQGYLEHHEEIDKAIKDSAANWKFERMALVDRAILQLATFELLFRDDIPSAVSINEAVDLAKKYGSANSGAFVNGVLDKIASNAKRKA